MSNESSGSQDRYRPVFQLLDTLLVQAIRSGEQKNVVAALKSQEHTEITEAISNRLIVRTFLVMQKGGLAVLDRQLSDQLTATQAARLIRDYLRELKSQFTDMFVAGKLQDKYAKLSGDKLFREALSAPGEPSAEIANKLIEINANSLTSPANMYEVAEYIRDSITETLWETVQDIRERGADEQVRADAKRVITEQVARLDSFIEGNLPRT